MKASRKVTRQNLKGYLHLKYHIPPQEVTEIIYMLTADAIQETDNIIYDRVYCLIALMLRDVYGFGPKRILRGMDYASKRMTDVGRTEGYWTTYAQELREKTGIVIQSDAENRLFMEYQGTDTKKGKELK